MLANTHNNSGNRLDRNVYAITIYPDGKISSGYISIEEKSDGTIVIRITKNYVDKVTVIKGE